MKSLSLVVAYCADHNHWPVEPALYVDKMSRLEEFTLSRNFTKKPLSEGSSKQGPSTMRNLHDLDAGGISLEAYHVLRGKIVYIIISILLFILSYLAYHYIDSGWYGGHGP